MLNRIYLDANASAPLLPEARNAMLAALGAANASSVHEEGRRAREIVEAARVQVADAVGARPEAVTFTSGATEAAALALSHIMLDRERKVALSRLYVGATEHPCVLAGGRFPPDAIQALPVTRSGPIDLAALQKALETHDFSLGAPLVALMLANNETGVIHPVAEAARIAKEYGAYVFCDAVQALGRIPVDIAALGVDFLALSAHKIGGPQGVGVLVLAEEDVRPVSLLTGGGQERRRRSGTENVAGIAGFGVAASLSNHHLKHADRIAALRAMLEEQLLEVSPAARVIGAEAERLPNTTLFAVPGLSTDVAVMAFDLEGIAVSAGSACSSGKVSASQVMAAMGMPPELGRSGIRVSLPAGVEAADIEGFIVAWRAIHARMVESRAA